MSTAMASRLEYGRGLTPARVIGVAQLATKTVVGLLGLAALFAGLGRAATQVPVLALQKAVDNLEPLIALVLPHQLTISIIFAFIYSISYDYYERYFAYWDETATDRFVSAVVWCVHPVAFVLALSVGAYWGFAAVLVVVALGLKNWQAWRSLPVNHPGATLVQSWVWRSGGHLVWSSVAAAVIVALNGPELQALASGTEAGSGLGWLAGHAASAFDLLVIATTCLIAFFKVTLTIEPGRLGLRIGSDESHARYEEFAAAMEQFYAVEKTHTPDRHPIDWSAWRPVLMLARPVNLVAVALAVPACAALSGFFPAAGLVVATLLVFAGAYAINDSVDQKADQRNRPGRAVARGAISPGGASVIAGLLYVSGILTGAASGSGASAGIVLFSIVSFLYSLWFQRWPIVKNLVAAALAASIFPLFTLSKAAGWTAVTTYLTVSAFVLNLGRELLKDAEDAPGDGEAGMTTLATLAGPGQALAIGVVVFLAGATFTAFPWFLRHPGLPGSTLAGVAVLSLGAFVAVVVRDARRQREVPRTAKRLVGIAKVNFLVTLSALAGAGVLP